MSQTLEAQSPRLLFGCAGARGPIEAYARRFPLLEIDLATPIKPATLRRMRREAGPALVVSLVAPRALSAAKPSPELDAALAQLLEAQSCIEAGVILLATPIELTPSSLQRERLAKVVARIREGLGEAASSVRIAWQPRGVWEGEAAAQFADELDVDLCMDPLLDPHDPFWDASIRYVRLATVGGRTDLPASRLRLLAELVVASTAEDDEDDRPMIVVFATPHAPREAKRFGTLFRTLSAGGGGDDVVRAHGEDMGFDDDDDDDDDDEESDEGDELDDEDDDEEA